MKQESKDTRIESYLKGLRKYEERGIPILIDGKEAESSEWQKLFQVCEDGSFYMGDYVLTEAPTGEAGGTGEIGIVGVTGAAGAVGAGRRQRLIEIRFDKVYYR